MDRGVVAKHKFARLSPKKAAIVMDLVRGKSLEKAKVALAFDETKAAKMILKVVKSAEANAINNEKLNPADLYVSEIYVGPGPMYKRAKMGAKGRVDPILKRTSHIYIKLSSVPEGLHGASQKLRPHSAHTDEIKTPSNVKEKKVKAKKPAKKEVRK